VIMRDNLGRLRQRLSPEGRVWTQDYGVGASSGNDRNRVVRITSERGFYRTFKWDANGSIIEFRDELNNLYAIGYDGPSARQTDLMARADAVPTGQAHSGLVIATRCTPTGAPPVRMGAQIAAGLKQRATPLVCEEAGMCDTTLREGLQALERLGLPPKVVFATGKPYEEILRRSADSHLLVIGSRPLTTLDPTWHLGDNATRIVRHMTASTLVVRGREHVRKILLSTDLPASAATVRMAQDVALATGASVEVLYTVPLPTLYVAETPSEATDVAQDAQRLGVEPDQLAQLQAIRSSLSDAGVSQATIKLRQGIVEEEIIKESVAGDFDLIVLREGYLRTPFGLLLGRLSSNIATRSPQASVLIVKR